jgi:hypothetical protein
MDYGENPWIWIIHELEVTKRYEDFISKLPKNETRHAIPRDKTITDLRKIVKAEISRCNQAIGIPYDACIFENHPPRRAIIGNCVMVFTALYYRIRIQTIILEIFFMLRECGLVNKDCLKDPTPMDFKGTANCDAVMARLSTFELVVQEERFRDKEIKNPHELWQLGATKQTLYWVSIMIVRNCGSEEDEMHDMFLLIEESGILAFVNQVALEKYEREFKFKQWERNVTEGYVERTASNGYTFGHRLPQGPGHDVTSQ